MSLETYSNESVINRKLQELSCALANFAAISKIVGRTRLTEALTGKRNLAQTDADKLMAILDEMAELQRASAIPLDWTKTDEIHEALQARREGKKFVLETAREL